MNAKGTRFLAVLAVMAMAFAAFAVVDLADGTASYSNRTITFDDGEINVAPGDTISEGGAYYFEASTEVTVSTTAPVVIFLVDGYELSIVGGASTTVGVYSAQKMANTSTSTTSTTGLTLTVKNGLKDACLDGTNFVVPSDLSKFTSLADVDLPVVSGNTYVVKNGKATIEANSNFAIAAGWTLKADVEFTAPGIAMTMSKDAVYEGVVSYVDELDFKSTAKLALKATADSTVEAGSIEITGTFTGEGLKSAIAEAAGEVILVDVTVTSGSVAINSSVEIVALTINEDATVSINAPINNVSPATVLTVNGTLNQGAGVDISNATIDDASTGTIKNVADASEMKTVRIEGVSTQTNFDADQIVYVVDNWTLDSGKQVTIKGQLIVPENARVVIPHDAELVIDNNAIVTLEGVIVIEAGDADEEEMNGLMSVYTGSVDVTGILYIAGVLNLWGDYKPIFGAVNVTDAGVVTVEPSGTLAAATLGDTNYSELNIGKDCLLNVQGALDIETIYNYGAVTIDSEVPAAGNSIIYQMADDAAVAVLKYTTYKTEDAMPSLTITDEKLVVYTKSDGTEFTVMDIVNGRSNVITIQPVDTVVDYISTFSGLAVVEEVKVSTGVAGTTGYCADSKKNYENTVVMSGALDIVSYYAGELDNPDANNASATVTVDAERGAKVLEDDAIIVGDKVTLANAGKLDVSGIVDASLYGQNVKAIMTNNGELTVIGDGYVAASQNKLGDVVNACEYKDGTTAYPYYVYLSIDAALDLLNEDSTITTMDVRGDNTITKSNVLPDKAVLNLKNNPTIQVGTTSSTDILFYIEDEAQIKGAGVITVDASMYAETSASVKTAEVISDVKSVEMNNGKPVKNGWVLWTNLSNALNTAEYGDTVTISREAEFVEIATNTEIKEGVTLEVPADYAALFLKDGVTLTVNGILDTYKDVYAETKFDVKAKNLSDNKSSAVVVNGILRTDKATQFGYVDDVHPAIMAAGAPISGAYFSIDAINYITALDVAMVLVDDIDAQITAYGTVNAGDLYFMASDTCTTLVIGTGLADIPTAVTVTSIELDGSRIESAPAAANLGTFTGNIIIDDNAVTAKALKGDADKFVISDASGKLTLGGKIKGTISVASGTVYTATGVNVDTTLTVAAGAKLSANGNNGQIRTLTVNGDLNVPNQKVISVDRMNLNGTVTVAPTTETAAAGGLDVNELFAGISDKDYDSTAATPAINGTFQLNDYAAIVTGASVDDDAKAVLDACFASEFFVDGKSWFTMYYVAGNQTPLIDKAPVEDAYFKGWKKNLSDTTENATYTPRIGGTTAGSVVKWYADIETHVYNIVIFTDAGVKSVAIDGIQLVSPMSGENRFQTTDLSRLEAGTHTVSFTYQSGYTGIVNLYTYPDGTILKDYKFTVSGTPEEEWGITEYLQLTGTAQIVEPEPEPTPVPEPENEWTVTTILLLVLVILIAVMAVIVALRLNRN